MQSVEYLAQKAEERRKVIRMENFYNFFYLRERMDNRAKNRLTEEDIIQIFEEDDNLSSGSDTRNDDDFRPSNDEQENLRTAVTSPRSVRPRECASFSENQRWTRKDVLLGCDRTTKWSESAPPPSRARAINIGTERAGPKGPARTGQPLQPETACFFFSENIIDVVVEHYNRKMDLRRANFAADLLDKQAFTKQTDQKLTYVGTSKKNKREIPDSFLPNKTHQEGSVLFGFKSDKIVVSYVPMKPKAVVLISSMHHTSKVDEYMGKPEIIESYNSTKSEVENLDQKCANYTTRRRKRRWPKTVFFSPLEVAGVNVSVLVNETSY
ncbi:hypothetical protein QYM36_000009 [Artemia franciscana]|uniref:PiggyBac transposable element-derived protein domain-containing protein n=1 Tax=Artemia franciscana TaxID=6661 RepID=A0AA88IER5_ARTSF|nr:hypothetical protein QYM36_000009 [Artemia franciscana]